MGNSKPNLEKAASRSPSELFGAWPPNWLHGKPIKLNPLLLYFCKSEAPSVSGDCFTGCCQDCKHSVINKILHVSYASRLNNGATQTVIKRLHGLHRTASAEQCNSDWLVLIRWQH